MIAEVPSSNDAASRAGNGSDIVRVGRQAGHALWLEQQLFEMLGSWAGEVAEPELPRLLATHAHHHAWHAELWRSRLPELAEYPPADLVRPCSDAVSDLVDRVRQAGTEQSVERLVGVYRVLLPRLASEYDAQLRSVSALTDGPTARVLKLCLADLIDDQRDGDIALLALTSASDGTTASAWLAELDALADAAGSLIG